jgi:hypothetical protein
VDTGSREESASGSDSIRTGHALRHRFRAPIYLIWSDIPHLAVVKPSF